MNREAIPYILFTGSLVLAVAVGLLLPDRLKVIQGQAEEWMLMGLLPAMLWVVWSLRKRPELPLEKAPAPKPESSAKPQRR